MDFDERGYLIPLERITTDLATIEIVFVEKFSSSITRRILFDAFIDYLTELKTSLNVPLEIWVNGSFITKKPNPNDVDFVIFVDRQVATVHHDTIYQFRQRRYAKKSVTDGYFVETVPENHPDYRIYQLNRDDKHRDFAFDRSGNPKGYVRLIF